MPNLVNISEAASLGIHALAFLARSERTATNQEIADALNASSHHLSKVMQRLRRAKLIGSTVGPQGGFKLKRPAKDIRLLEIYEAIDGPVGEAGCLLGKPACGGQCVLGEMIEKVNREVHQHLSKTTLARLVDSVVFASLQEPDNDVNG